jgi:hypothetical protein
LQVILNLFVVGIVLYGSQISSNRVNSVKFVLYFIVNLALADLAGFCLTTSAIKASKVKPVKRQNFVVAVDTKSLFRGSFMV